MEEEYYRFNQGAFGLECSLDSKKKALKRYKNALRRLITNEPDEYWRQIYYMRHIKKLREIENAVAKVNEIKIPSVAPINEHNTKFERAQALQQKIDRDNALLVSNIHRIYNKRNPNLSNKNLRYVINRNWKSRLADTFQIGLENCAMHERIKAIKPLVPSPADYHRWYTTASKYKLLASRFPPFWNSRVCAPFEEVAWRRAKEIPRPVVYLDFEVLGKGIGRIAIELRADLVPMTCENFRSLCTGDRGRSYKCTEISVILKGILWQGGAGVTSIYGESFPNENFKMKHDAEGILSMVNYGRKTNNSEFRITAKPLPPLDGKHVAFGKVIMGMDYLKKMALLAGVTERGKPKTKLVVTGCGETTEEELINLPPPMTLKEQQVASDLKKLEKKRKRKDDKDAGLFDEFDDIPTSGSYTEFKPTSKGGTTTGTDEDETMKPNSSSSSDPSSPTD